MDTVPAAGGVDAAARRERAATEVGLMRRGQSLVWFVLMLPVLIGMAGAAITMGVVYAAQARLQNAVDAAALAGAQVAAQGGDPASQAGLIPQDDPGATGSVTAGPRTGQVTASGVAAAPGGLLRLFGFDRFGIRARAVAAYGPGYPFDFALLQGGTTTPLDLNGDVSVDGNAHSNSTVVANGNVCVTGAFTAAQGGSITNGPHRSGCTATVGIGPVVPLPAWTASQLTRHGSWTIIGSPEDPAGWTVNGSTTLSGNVLVYGNVTLNGDVHGTGAIVAMDGNLTLNGNVDDTGGTGVTLAALAARGQGADGTGQQGNVIENGNVRITGILYAPEGEVVLNGNPQAQGSVIGRRIVLNGNVGITYDPSVLTSVPVQTAVLIQ
ncbi:putative Tad domain-containing protein [Candidatus Hydrogenisulfobacillus filiaventi]|uniref:Putative Tad domain-containing protein n=1 Tax=Candidatus Hydrogenisulfobacillus filiaventi TaxID=2707344 RepID=A0A6F8ZDW9_9FIRM|nr:pilus assembly protein [Bacillota bacterium]CAB1127884.1 putative Tad domain-containing protein [Candidatus Hydrogenisulfobacillus filiaventi]